MRMRNYDEGADHSGISLFGLALVAVTVAIALWWWTHGVWGNFSWSFLENAATSIGFDNARRPAVGAHPAPSVEPAPLARTEAPASEQPDCNRPGTRVRHSARPARPRSLCLALQSYMTNLAPRWASRSNASTRIPTTAIRSSKRAPVWQCIGGARASSALPTAGDTGRDIGRTRGLGG